MLSPMWTRSRFEGPLKIGHKPQATSHKPQATSHKPQVTSHKSQVTSLWLVAVGCWLSLAVHFTKLVGRSKDVAYFLG
jgi:hypothetical protein